jgi:hypothetical protein
MLITVKILSTKSPMRYCVRRLVVLAETVLMAEYPDLEVKILELKTTEEIYKYTQVLMAPGLVINEKLVYNVWIPTQEMVFGWMRDAIAEMQPVQKPAN